jgi:hypothetical protein
MLKHTIALSIGLAFGLGNAFAADAMTREVYKAEKDKIEAQAKADKQACEALKDNPKDICQAEAKAKEKIAKAELDARNKPGAKADEKVRMMKAEGTYEVAKERCEDQIGDGMTACKKDAKVAYDKAKAEAKLSTAKSKAADAKKS